MGGEKWERLGKKKNDTNTLRTGDFDDDAM